MASKQPACYKWLSDGTRLMSGSTFIEAIKIRLKSAFEKKGYTSILELTIATAAGIRRPDIVCWKGDSAHVIDTTVCADAHAGRMEDVYQKKVNYYQTEDINRWVRLQSGVGSVSTDALVINWRRLMSSIS